MFHKKGDTGGQAVKASMQHNYSSVGDKIQPNYGPRLVSGEASHKMLNLAKVRKIILIKL